MPGTVSILRPPSLRNWLLYLVTYDNTQILKNNVIVHNRFLNKGLSDFNLALDLGFLTKARKYTFFKPKFIFYATYLSEKIGYWRYITIYRHLKQNPEYQCYPIFKYFENWCQDENRHGDFFSALMKAQPQFLNDWKAKLWSRFFCLSVIKVSYNSLLLRISDCLKKWYVVCFYEINQKLNL